MATNMTNGTTHTEVLESKNDLHWNLTYGNGTGWAQADDAETRFVVDQLSLAGYLEVGGFQTTGLVAPGTVTDEVLSNGVDTFLYETVFSTIAGSVFGPGFDTFDPKLAFENLVSRMNNIKGSMTNR